MKRLFFIFCLLLVLPALYAQTPGVLTVELPEKKAGNITDPSFWNITFHPRVEIDLRTGQRLPYVELEIREYGHIMRDTVLFDGLDELAAAVSYIDSALVNAPKEPPMVYTYWFTHKLRLQYQVHAKHFDVVCKYPAIDDETGMVVYKELVIEFNIKSLKRLLSVIAEVRLSIDQELVR